MNKKGISPLMAWILIIAFAIAMGAFIMNWATNQVGKFDPSQNSELYCSEVDFSVDDFCIDGVNEWAKLNITNTGRYTIRRWTVARATEQSPLGSCYILDDLEPNKMMTEDVGLGYRLDNTTETFECDYYLLQGGEALDYPTSIEVVPWINIDNQSIACLDVRKKINTEFFERVC